MMHTESLILTKEKKHRGVEVSASLQKKTREKSNGHKYLHSLL